MPTASQIIAQMNRKLGGQSVESKSPVDAVSSRDISPQPGTDGFSAAVKQRVSALISKVDVDDVAVVAVILCMSIIYDALY